MDSLIASAARLLTTGDPLAALKRVALRDDPPALALRGIAMAQLGDYERARKLLRRAAHNFGSRERLAQAMCQVAEAEVALAARDLTRSAPRLDTAAQALDALGDHANALHARLVEARRQLLVGELDAAEQTLAVVSLSSTTMPPPLVARAELTRAELALRRVRVADAEGALDRAHSAALPGSTASSGMAPWNPIGAKSAGSIRRRAKSSTALSCLLASPCPGSKRAATASFTAAVPPAARCGLCASPSSDHTDRIDS